MRIASERRIAGVARGRPRGGSSGGSIPGLPEAERLDLELRQRAQRLAGEFLAFAERAQAAIDAGVPARFGYVDPETYFEERIGLSWRSIRRWLAVVEGLRRLPDDAARQSAAAAVSALGGQKAAILAPVLGRAGENWETWTHRAATLPRERLQAEVSAAVGAKPRGEDPPGAAFLRFILSRLPDEETRALVGSVFEAVFELTGSPNAVGAFIHIVQEASSDIFAAAVAKRKGMLA